MISISAECTLREYFTPDGFGQIPANHRKRLSKIERRELIEALIEFYEDMRDKEEKEALIEFYEDMRDHAS